MSTQLRGARFHLPAEVAPEPIRSGRPRRWVLSLGVLAVLTAIAAAGGVLVHGAGEEASYGGLPDASASATGRPAPAPAVLGLVSGAPPAAGLDRRAAARPDPGAAGGRSRRAGA